MVDGRSRNPLYYYYYNYCYIVADVLDTKSSLSGCYVVLVQRSRCYYCSFISLYRNTIGGCNALRTTRNFRPGLLIFWQTEKEKKKKEKKKKKEEEVMNVPVWYLVFTQIPDFVFVF